MTIARLRRVLLPIAGVFGGLVAAIFLLLTILPQTGLYATYTVLSDSMQPAIAMGSVVVVAPVDPSTLKTGDIISFTAAQAPYPTLTHRIQSIGTDGSGRLTFKTKGDFNLVVDPWQVHYKSRGALVVAAIPLAGYALTDVTTPLARSLLGLLLAGILGFFWFSAVWGRPRLARQAEALPAGQPARRALALDTGPSFSWLRMAILGCLAVALISHSRWASR